ncbi:hypothetical protein T07_3976 [Trichinella nelsoni]|uniref:Uncharacterized protein n=1 Tax=Trichinella nelsoni TaxID=6336 RepID=A0A0V0RBS9_9BILA|nr:hypothetical protein T07_3976 [Trichinella nelsoni]
MMIELANETRFTNHNFRRENPVDASFIFSLNLNFCKYQQEPPTILHLFFFVTYPNTAIVAPPPASATVI